MAIQYGVTDTGFKAKSFDILHEETKQAFINSLNIEISKNPDKVLSILTNQFLYPLSVLWSNQQALATSRDIDSAAGVWLDSLCALQQVTRNLESFSTGELEVWVSNSVTLPAQAEFKSSAGDVVVIANTLSLGKDNAEEVRVKYLSTAGNIMSITVNTQTFSTDYVNTHGGDIVAAMTDLAQQISLNTPSGATANVITANGETLLRVYTTDLTTVAVTLNSNLGYDSFKRTIPVRAKNTGAIVIAENQVTVAPSYAAIISVNNPQAISGGSEEESDESLRNRYKLTVTNAGSATVEALRAALLAIPSVTDAFVVENDTNSYDGVNDIPAKAFKAVVKGGTNEEVASAIWLNKPAGISTAGNTTVSIKDSYDNEVNINFSRITDLYVFIDVSYTLYDEEEFPLDGEDLMRAAILSYGDGLSIGKDLIRQRIEAAITNSVEGVESVTVRYGVSLDPNTTPSLVTTNKIAVSNLYEGRILEGNITIARI